MNSETIKELYELVKDAPERQIDSGAALDTKMLQIFSLSSVVLGFTAFSFSSATADGGLWVTRLLIGAMGAYVISTVTAIWYLRPNRYKHLEMSEIWNHCYMLTPGDAMHSVITKSTEAFDHNKSALKRKSIAIQVVLGTLFVEIVCVALALIFARLS